MHVVYPGSFDPPTLGHLALVERAHQLFDRVTVVVANNPDKSYWLSEQERSRMFSEMTSHLKGLEVKVDGGLIVRVAHSVGASAIVKGLRSEGDFHQEQVMAEANSVLGNGLPTVFLMAEGRLRGVSSSLVRQVHQLGGDIRAFVAPAVFDRLKNREP